MTIAFDGFHLAEVNLAKARHDMDDPRMAGFVDNLEKINGMGDNSPGAVWRYQDDSGAALDTQVFDDPLLFINLTVWESIEDLRAFTVDSEHVNFIRRRLEWFDRNPSLPTITMWWIPIGTLPTLDEMVERVHHLRDNGPTPYAFTFKDHFPPEG